MGEIESDVAKAVDEAVAEVREKAMAMSPRVVDLRCEVRKDPNGWDAAIVTLVVEDAASGEPYSSAKLRPLHDLVWDVFQRRSVSVNPYVYFQLKSEQAA